MRGLTSRCETWERGSEWLPLTYLADIPSTWAHIVTLVIDAGGHGVTPVVMGTPHSGPSRLLKKCSKGVRRKRLHRHCGSRSRLQESRHPAARPSHRR